MRLALSIFRDRHGYSPRPPTPCMADRILKVNAFTTLNLLNGYAEGHDFEDEALAVCNVTTARTDPEHVKVQVELDNTEVEHLPAHADELRLSPAEARDIAAALEAEAETVEATTAETTNGTE
jgi:hypothetical protein